MTEQTASPPARVYFRLLRLHQRVALEMTNRLRAIGLSVPQFDVLSTMTEREGLTQSELAQRLYVTKGNVSGLVDRLVDAGYVERRPIPGDRRSNALFLTTEGRQVVQRGIALQGAFIADTIGQLGAGDLADLERLLLSWRDRVRAVQDISRTAAE
jgi:DNA-binding MarR family transcriptional regulator